MPSVTRPHILHHSRSRDPSHVRNDTHFSRDARLGRILANRVSMQARSGPEPFAKGRQLLGAHVLIGEDEDAAFGDESGEVPEEIVGWGGEEGGQLDGRWELGSDVGGEMFSG